MNWTTIKHDGVGRYRNHKTTVIDCDGNQVCDTICTSRTPEECEQLARIIVESVNYHPAKENHK